MLYMIFKSEVKKLTLSELFPAIIKIKNRKMKAMKFKTLALEFKMAMMNLPKQAQEFISEVTSPETLKKINEAIQSGKIHGVTALNNIIDTIGEASFPQATAKMKRAPAHNK